MTVDINKDNYIAASEERLSYKSAPGLSEDIVRKISADKQEPAWMLELRLKALQKYNETPMPNWGPDLSGLELEKIHYYLLPDAKKNSTSWEDVPKDIKETFEKLGIPEAERSALAGTGAQFEATNVYHKLKEELEEQGVVFLDMDEALKQHESLVKKYFNKCIPYVDHKFIMLHYAVWSGGTFLYVPKGVKVTQPVQAYFRMNAERGGQFEHTLIIVEEEAEASYIEGCFAKGTLISCNPEYKKIEDVWEGDKVLTTAGEFKKTTDLQRQPYTGPMYRIKFFGDSTQDLQATGNHPFLYVERKYKNDRNKEFKPEWNIPRYFKKGDYLCMPINQVVKEKKEHTFTIRKGRGMKEVKITIPFSKEFFRLVGYYLAEGSISNDSYLNFSFGATERELITDVKKCLKSIGVKKTIETQHEKNNGTNVVVCSVDYARIFKQLGTKCDKKKLLPWMMYLQKDYQKEIIKGWYRGDGNYYNKRAKSGHLKEVFRINTTSETLVRQGRDVLLRLGVFGFINKRERWKTGRKSMYTLGITGDHMIKFGKLVGQKVEEKLNGKNRASKFGIDEQFAYVPIKSVEEYQAYEEIVYNFGVEDHETYTVGGVAVHNCSAPKYNSSSLHAGCVELFVGEKSKLRYSSVENWSSNTYNLNTKRAIVDDDGYIEFIGGNIGSGCTMLYPASILKGKNSKAEHLSIAFAAAGQVQDTGAKVYHIGRDTSSTIISKSISKTGGKVIYRGLVKVNKDALRAKSNVECDSLMIGKGSKSDTYPLMDIKEKTATVGHEATVGKIGEEQLFYLRSRGLNEEAAVKLIVAGFINPITKELPLEYAMELNKLIELEMEGSVG